MVPRVVSWTGALALALLLISVLSAAEISVAGTVATSAGPDSAGLIMNVQVVSPDGVQEGVKRAAWFDPSPTVRYRVRLRVPDSNGWHVLFSRKTISSGAAVWRHYEVFSGPNQNTGGPGKLQGSLQASERLVVTAWTPPPGAQKGYSRALPLDALAPRRQFIDLEGQDSIRYLFRFVAPATPDTVFVYMTRSVSEGM